MSRWFVAMLQSAEFEMLFLRVAIPDIIAAAAGSFLGWWICMALMTSKGYFDNAASGDNVARGQHFDAVRATRFFATTLGSILGIVFTVFHLLQRTVDSTDFTTSTIVFGSGFALGTLIAFFGLRYRAMINK